MLVIAHGDADGVCCAALLMKHFNSTKIPVVFTSPAALKDTLCRNMIKRRLDELYIFDLSGNKKTLRIVSAWDKVVWIDHHNWEPEESFENVEIIVKSSPSAARIVAEYFGIEEERLLKAVDEVDTNSVQSEEAALLRNTIGAIKWLFGRDGKKLQAMLGESAKIIAENGLEGLQEQESFKEMRERYQAFVSEVENEALEKVKVYTLADLKIAVYETPRFLPVYAISNALLKHAEAPFDVIAVLFHRANGNSLSTKMELRTHTGFDVQKIAMHFNGGGHKVAAGASLEKLLLGESFIEELKEILGKA